MEKQADYRSEMRIAKTIVLCLCLSIFNLSSLFSQLSGIYTVGAAGDYADLEAVASDLYTHGVDGPVTFNIFPGTYAVHVTIPHITGSSEVNTVTFQSSTQDSSDVILQHVAIDQDDNWVLYLNGPDNISFKHLTFKAKSESALWGGLVVFDSFCSNVTFSNNAFYGKEANDASAGRIIVLAKVENKNEDGFSNLEFTNNYFFRGSYALHFQGPNDTYMSGVVVRNNIFEENGYTGVFCNFCYAPVITYNTIEALSYGIRVNGDHGGGTYSFNKVYSNHQGMSIQRYGAGERALVSNNFVTIGSSGDYGISISNSVLTDVLSNSVYSLSTSWDSRAFYCESAVNNVPTVTIKNNNFACEYHGYALYVGTENVISEMSNNNLYTAGNHIARWVGTRIFDVKELQDISGMSENSLSVYPHFLDERDLHTIAPWLDGKGISNALITSDIDGESRAGSPDIGADEFTADPALTTPLDGALEYTIGAGGSYPDFESAMADALIKGVSAPVSFGFLEGIFDDQFVIKRIPGSSAVNRITIQSASSNTENAKLTFSSELYDENYVFKFHGADFVTLRNLDIEAEGETYSKVIDLKLGCDSIIIENNNLRSPSNTNNNENISIICSDDSDFRSRIIRNNRIIEGAIGIYMRRYQSNFQYPTGAVIEGNTFENTGYLSIYLQFYNSPQILGNTFNANAEAINAFTCIRDLRIQGNSIHVESGDAVSLSSCTANEDHYGIISNNFITCGGTRQSDGLNINNTDFLRIYYNSVNITSTRADSRAIYISTSTAEEMEIHNNVFANQDAGVAAYIANPAFISSSDNNNFFCRGDNLVYWGENVSDLAALQTLSSMDANSVSGNPLFTSDTDLHTGAAILDSAASYILAIPTDIDGDIRNLNYPDIGADEFSIGLNQPPYVDKAIPDQAFEWNTGKQEIAFLDTVFQDPDPGDILTYSAVDDMYGVSLFIEDKVLKLSSAEGVSGVVEIIVTASDPLGASVNDTLIVDIYIPVNHPPVAMNDTVLTMGEITIEVLANDYDEDGDAIRITEVLYFGVGSASIINSNSAILYDPGNFIELRDTIIYIIKDVHNDPDTARVFITLYRMMEGFYLLETELEGLSHGGIKWGDYDSDGDRDILQTGWTGTMMEFRTKIISNTGTGFEESAHDLTGLSAGTSSSIDWIDIDGDNDLDLIITGRLDGNEGTKKTMIYGNWPDYFLEMENSGVPDLSSTFMSWADINFDGKYDLILSGTGESGDQGDIYLYNGSDFTEVSAGLQVSHSGESYPVDIDNDGDLDIFMCGSALNPSVFYINDGGVFTKTETEIPGVYNASADLADIDADGDMDIAIMGNTGTELILHIYRNDGQGKKDGEWFNLTGSYSGIESGDLAWADFDNDGDIDLAVTGTKDQYVPKTIILLNESGVFLEMQTDIVGVGRSALAWGDYDNDGDLDLALQGTDMYGPVTAIYRNDNHVANTPPTVPNQLVSEVQGHYLALSWQAATDDLSDAQTLRYNVRVGTTSGANDILSSMSDGDFMRKPGASNAGNATNLKLSDLEAAIYYWSVQAVDQGWAASEFSAEGTVDLLNGIPGNSLEDPIKIFPNPASDKIWISSIESGEYHIQISDLSGRVVLERKYHAAPSSEHELALENLNSGVYVINIIVNNKAEQFKLVIR